MKPLNESLKAFFIDRLFNNNYSNIILDMMGYSGTQLAKKLGIKAGFNIQLVNAPDYDFKLFTDLPTNLLFEEFGRRDFIHFLLNKRMNVYSNHLY